MCSRLFVCATTLLFSSLAAHADTYQVAFTPYATDTVYTSASFDVQSSPQPSAVGGVDFVLLNVTAEIGGESSTGFHAVFGDQAGIYFFEVTQNGVLTPYGGTMSLPGVFDYYPSSTPALYTGTLQSPTLQLGSFDGAFGVLDVTDLDPSATQPAAVTPEPSSFALLGTGLLGAAGILRKRFA